MKYNVKRQHYGDRQYYEGEIREAEPRDVEGLVARGILAPVEKKAAPAVKNKAAPAVKNKSEK